jgi:hypothetical protein
MTPPSFLDYFLEQEPWHGALYLVPPLALYLLVLAVPALVAARRGRVHHWRAVAAAGAALGVFLFVLALFDGVVLYLRHVPHGVGAERVATRDEFVLVAKLALVGVYVVVGAAALGFGRVLGLSWRAAGEASAVALGFLVLTFRFVEFLNACYIGEPVLWPSYIEC